MQLKELKAPYEALLPKGESRYNLNDIADQYLQETDSHKRDVLFSILVCGSWVALESIYFQKGNSDLSVEECYDIYIDALYYVLGKQIWHNEDSKLYQDPDAFVKAVRVSSKHLRLNYVESQFKQKRKANNYALSVESLEEDFQEGLFTEKTFIDKQLLIEEGLTDVIYKLFKKKRYLDAYILNAILFEDVFSTVDYTTTFSYKKTRKSVRHLDCKLFASRYNVSIQEVENSLKYFNNYSNVELDRKIKKCLLSWKNDPIILKTFR